MRAGQQVRYVRGGTVHDATVSAVTGSGPSGYKTLDLRLPDSTAKDVPHATDAEDGYWSLEPATALRRRIRPRSTRVVKRDKD